MSASGGASGGPSARSLGVARCPACGTLSKVSMPRCRACGARVHVRIPHSLQRTWAFLAVGLMAYVPANLLPIMSTRSYEGNRSDTIMSGVVELAAQGSPGVAAIVFAASICIPMIKFAIIAGLALSLHLSWPMSGHVRHRLHTVTELIGRWSMIDVFVVAVLAALIQLGAIITITPGAGINAFAVSVVFTMLSALSLDARLIWDEGHGSEPSPADVADPVPDASSDTPPDTFPDAA